jgi:hypothetical protein
VRGDREQADMWGVWLKDGGDGSGVARGPQREQHIQRALGGVWWAQGTK